MAMTDLERGNLGRGEWDFFALQPEERFVRPMPSEKSGSGAREKLVASVIDQLLANPDASRTSSRLLQKALSEGEGLTLREAYAGLAPSHKKKLKNIIGLTGVNQLLTLAQEDHPEWFARNLMSWAQKQEDRDNFGAAGLIYQLLMEEAAPGETVEALSGVSASLRQEAKDHWSVIQGGGPAGLRIEHQFKRYVEAALDPSMIIGMAVGGTIFTKTRSLILNRLFQNPVQKLWTRGLGANALASTTALFPEVGGFWATSKLINEARFPGVQSWDWQSNFHEMRGLMITLSGLKIFGAAFGRGAAWAKKVENQSLATPLSRHLAAASEPVWKQGGMLLGIMSGHGFEMAAGWRDPQDLSSLFLDSMIFLTQFNIGGKVSELAFPNLYARNKALTAQVMRQERYQWLKAQESLGRQILGARRTLRRVAENIFKGPGSGGQGALAAVGVHGNGHEISPETFESRGIQEAQELYVKSSGGEGDGRRPSSIPPSSAGTGGKRGSSSEIEVVFPDFYDQYDPASLPSRTGERLDPKGEMVTDPILEVDDVHSFPRDMLMRVPEAPRNEVLEKLGFSEKELEGIQETKLDHIGLGEFGTALGMAWAQRTQDYFKMGLDTYTGKRLSELEPLQRGVLESLGELTHLAQHSYRTGMGDVTNAYERAIGQLGEVQVPLVARGLRNYLMPRLGEDILGLHEGVVAHGSGAMAVAMMVLYRHMIAPGERGMFTPLVLLPRDQAQADEINKTGLNTTYLDEHRRINFRHDPPIIAVGPKGLKIGSREVTQEDIKRTFRLQMLMVPSAAHVDVMTESFVRGLPKDARLLHASKGFIGPNRGEHFSPKRRGVFYEDQPTLVPYELDNMALGKWGRAGDVKVVSGGGYAPDKYVINHKFVEMVFAGPEEGKRQSPAAEEVAVAVAGPGRNNQYVRISATHHQHSVEIGNGIKNVESLQAGEFGVLYALEMVGRGDRDPNLNDRYQDDSYRRLHDLAIEVLRNENKIKESRLRYDGEVRDDFRECFGINIENLIGLIERLHRDIEAGSLDIRDNRAIVNWVVEEIIAKRYEYSNVRNTVVGIIGGIVRHLQKMGATLKVSDINFKKLKLTTEGVNSLPPFVLRNNYLGHEPHLKHQPEEFYDLHDFYNPDSPADRPAYIPPKVRAALLEQIPGFDIAKLKEGLQTASQRSVDNLEGEIRLLEDRRREYAADPNNNFLLASLDRQVELLQVLVESMTEGNLMPVADFPFYAPGSPYQNVFIVPIGEGRFPRAYRAFIKVDAQGVQDRLTQLGTFLNSLRPEADVHIEVEVTGLDSNGNEAAEMQNFRMEKQIRRMARRMVEDFSRSRKSESKAKGKKPRKLGKITMEVNDTWYEIKEGEGRPEYDEIAYARDMDPLVRRLVPDSDENPVDFSTIRTARRGQTVLMNKFLQKRFGWPMMLGSVGGPLQRAVKAGLARPEKKTMIGIEDAETGELVEAFMVYRGMNNKPMVLNQGVIRDFEQAFPERSEYKQPGGELFFEGIPLEPFLTDFEVMAERRGHAKLRYRIMNLKSLPVEYAMAGILKGVNPAILRNFLYEREHEGRDQMLRELAPFYERGFDANRGEIERIFRKYLDPYFEANREEVEQDHLYKLVQLYGHNAIKDLIYRRYKNPQAPESSPLPQ